MFIFGILWKTISGQKFTVTSKMHSCKIGKFVFVFILDFHCAKILTFFVIQISLCGYNNAVVFQTIQPSDIDFIEQFVRNELAQILSNSNSTEKEHFFDGFAINPKEFTFSRGERQFINQIVIHLKDVGKSTEALARFKETETDSNEITPNFVEKCQTYGV